jgi:hypothetical protein
MSKSKGALVCLALFLALNLVSAMAFGGILDYGTPYTDVLNVTWKGTSPFAHATSGLTGEIDWIVYGPGQFPYGDSGFSPPAGEYSYVYQIRNTSVAVAISDLTFSVQQTVGPPDSFISPGRVEGELAAFTDYVSGPGGWVEWGFNHINAGSSSAGLIYTSPKAPEVTLDGRITNGGSSVGGIQLPAPGPNDIPEPGTIALLFAGAGCFVLARRISRR